MSFAAELQKACDRAKGRAADVVRATAVGLQSGMVQRCPVDSGRLRANFQIGIGAINPRTTSSEGSDPVGRAQSAMASWRIGQTIWLTNSLPYAHVAEYGLYGKPPGSANGPKTRGGYSTQAPGGFVRLTVQDFEQTFRRAAKAAK